MSSCLRLRPKFRFSSKTYDCKGSAGIRKGPSWVIVNLFTFLYYIM